MRSSPRNFPGTICIKPIARPKSFDRKLRHVVFISADGLRPDFATRGPMLRKLLSEGTVFSGCRSVSPEMETARAALLTGRWGNLPSVGAPTLAKRFSDAGFVALSQGLYPSRLKEQGLIDWSLPIESIRHVNNMVRTFDYHVRAGRQVFLTWFTDFFHFPFGIEKSAYEFRNSRHQPMIDAYLKLLERKGRHLNGEERERVANDSQLLIDEIFSIWWDPSIEAGRERDREFAALFSLATEQYDHYRLERFIFELEATGALEETLLVFTGAAGTCFTGRSANLRKENGDHPTEYHIIENPLTEDRLRVPLVFWAKNYPVRAPAADYAVSTLDVVPTVLSCFGIPYRADELSGCDLHRLDAVSGARHRYRAAASLSTAEGLLKMSVEGDGRLKLLTAANGTQAFFDLVDDPEERINLLQLNPAAGARKLSLWQTN